MYQQSELLETIMKKYHMHKNQKITFKEIQKIAQKEEIEIKDLICLLQISTSTLNKLKKEKQKYTNLRFDKYKTLSFQAIIKEGIIYKEQFEEIKNSNNLKKCTLLRLLGISTYRYKKSINSENTKMNVIDIKTRHIVELVKMDFKYIKKYKIGYYSKEILEDICQKRSITLEQFIKYYNRNPKHYKFNKIAISKSEKGLWIGEKIRVPDEFLSKYYDKITKLLKYNSQKYEKNNEWMIYREDIIQETILAIYESCGEIVKKFYFDTELILRILASKGKYIMYGIYKEKYNTNNVYYDGYDSKLLDHMSIMRDKDDYIIE